MIGKMMWALLAIASCKTYSVDLFSEDILYITHKTGKKVKYPTERIPNAIAINESADPLNLANWVIGKEALEYENVIKKPFDTLLSSDNEMVCLVFLMKLFPTLSREDEVVIVCPNQTPLEIRAKLWHILRSLSVKGRVVRMNTAMVGYVSNVIEIENETTLLVTATDFGGQTIVVQPGNTFTEIEPVVEITEASGLETVIGNYAQVKKAYAFGDLATDLEAFLNEKFPEIAVTRVNSPYAVLEGSLYTTRKRRSYLNFDRRIGANITACTSDDCVEFNHTMILGAREIQSIEVAYNETVNVMIDDIEAEVGYRNLVTDMLKGYTDLYNHMRTDLANGTEPQIQLNFGMSDTFDCVDLVSAYVIFNVSLRRVPALKLSKHKRVSTESLWRGHGPFTNDTRIEDFKLDFSLSLIPAVYSLSAETSQMIPQMYYNKTDGINYTSQYLDYTELLRHFATNDIEFESVTTEEERVEIIRRIDEFEANITAENFDNLSSWMKNITFKFHEGVTRYAAVQELNNSMNAGDEALKTAAPKEADLETYHKVRKEAQDLFDRVSAMDPKEVPTITTTEILKMAEEMNEAVDDLTPKSFTISFGPDGRLVLPKNAGRKGGMVLQKNPDGTWSLKTKDTKPTNQTHLSNSTQTSNLNQTDPSDASNVTEQSVVNQTEPIDASNVTEPSNVNQTEPIQSNVTEQSVVNQTEPSDASNVTEQSVVNQAEPIQSNDEL